MSRLTRVALVGAAVGLISLMACNDSTSPPDVPDGVNAGPALLASAGTYVTMDGSASCGQSGLTCHWRQVAGPDVTGGHGTMDGELPGFTAPDSVTSVAFELRVGNGDALSPPDTLTVVVVKFSDRALFVSRTGWDTNPGTPAWPLRTLQRAIQTAAAVGNGTDLYIAEGTYTGTITLGSGVSLYGGFSRTTWVRDPVAHPTIIDGGRKAVVGTDVSDLEIDGLAIRSASGIDDGAEEDRSSIGIWLSGTSNVRVNGNTIDVGDGTSGKEGLAGWAGRDGLAGLQGGAGREDDNPPGDGGAGGLGWPHTGGHGGAGGWEEQAGQNGDSGFGKPGGRAGLAGGAGDPGGDGTVGGKGNDGPAGIPGAPGTELGLIHPTFGYLPADGSSGRPGVPGTGGGGGGGGGSQYGGAVTDGAGNGGGGGGGGGGSGQGGGGGYGGGGSLAIVVFDGTGTVVTNNAITTGNGGPGGAAGSGGKGGAGGLGGDWQRYEAHEIGEGAAGGNGGKGGNGGPGGGGGGGPSVGIVQIGGDSLIRTGNTITLGQAGFGGTSPAGANYSGATGVATEYYQIPWVTVREALLRKEKAKE